MRRQVYDLTGGFRSYLTPRCQNKIAQERETTINRVQTPPRSTEHARQIVHQGFFFAGHDDWAGTVGPSIPVDAPPEEMIQ